MKHFGNVPNQDEELETGDETGTEGGLGNNRNHSKKNYFSFLSNFS